MLDRERPSGKPGRRTDRRDLLVVTTICVAVFAVGLGLGVYDAIARWMSATLPLSTADLAAMLAVGLAGVGTLAVLRWRGARKEHADRMRIEQQLHAAEDRYRTIVERVSTVSYVWDPAGKRGTAPATYISPQIEQLLGYTPEEWDENPELWSALAHPDDRVRVLEAWRDATRIGARFSADYRMYRKDGDLRWIRDEATPFMTGADDLLQYQGVMIDVTESRLTLQDLEIAERRYRTLVEQLPAVVYIDAVDELSTALYISPRYEEVFGFTPQERMEDPGLWVRQIHPEDSDRVREESERTNQTGDPFDIEYRWIRRDGATIWVHDQARQVEAAGGVWVWQGVLTDISERKTAQEALERRDRILEAAGLAAERFLRAPSWVECIDEVLARVGQADDASRAFVFRNDRLEDGRLAMTKVFEWNAPGMSPTLDAPYNTLYPYQDGYGDWEALLPQGAVIQELAQELEPRKREWLEAEGIRSSLALPIFVDREWWGFIGLNACEDPRAWQPAEIEALRVVASTLGAAIGRARDADILAETQNRYRTLIEQLPAATFITSPEAPHETIYISPQIEAILGYSSEEWTSDIWERSLHPEDADRVRAEDARTNATGETHSIDYRMRTRDGRWVWVHDEAQRIRDATGKPLYWQGVRSDITERKETEQQLREAEERFRRLVEQLPAITYVDTYDPSWEDVWPTSYISPQVEAILGYSALEWRSDPYLWRRMVHPEDRDRVNLANEQHYMSEEPMAVELRVFHKNGGVRWIRDEAVIIRGEDGASRQSQGILQDITERKVVEYQLHEAEERYRAIVEHVPAVIYVDAADPGMRTIYISPHVFEMTGYTPQEWMDDPQLWLKVAHENDREAIATTYQGALTNQEPWKADYRLLTRDGRTIWVHDETTIIRDESGAPRFLQGVIFDVTERKLAEQTLRDSEQRERDAAERLRALDEMKNTFLAAVSHELRSPLTSILGLSLTLERTREMPSDDRNDLLGRLSANARKLDRLLKDLLDIDRLNRGIVEPQYRLTDVGELARRAVESLDALAGRVVHIQADPVMVSIDPAKVERIVENLVMNAVRHTAADRRIWLSVTAEAPGVLISVDDDGPGVPEALRNAIFEPFRQGPTASPHAPGTGIGLSLVARFAELHGGRAWVEDRPGGGASFKVSLPDLDPADASVPASPQATGTRS